MVLEAGTRALLCKHGSPWQSRGISASRSLFFPSSSSERRPALIFPSTIFRFLTDFDCFLHPRGNEHARVSSMRGSRGWDFSEIVFPSRHIPDQRNLHPKPAVFSTFSEMVFSSIVFERQRNVHPKPAQCLYLRTCYCCTGNAEAMHRYGIPRQRRAGLGSFCSTMLRCLAHGQETGAMSRFQQSCALFQRMVRQVNPWIACSVGNRYETRARWNGRRRR
ncbi:hypothetical protein EJ06DRAFT_369981 [Trichodelitschia bisporula]|uniref:Uncharacterized protein n=1 Tax=Trichodelitschia bisporula TaxID=703511 RepID=A0A6G1I140_9PEZI|nr:hypothetical protein EJ06DRAFT_369981 [Trichodelitschia bisporula]